MFPTTNVTVYYDGALKPNNVIELIARQALTYSVLSWFGDSRQGALGITMPQLKQLLARDGMHEILRSLDGFEELSIVRANDYDGPIIMLTG